MRIFEGLSVGISAIRSNKTPFAAHHARHYHRGRCGPRNDCYRGRCQGDCATRCPKIGRRKPVHDVSQRS